MELAGNHRKKAKDNCVLLTSVLSPCKNDLFQVPLIKKSASAALRRKVSKQSFISLKVIVVFLRHIMNLILNSQRELAMVTCACQATLYEGD